MLGELDSSDVSSACVAETMGASQCAVEKLLDGIKGQEKEDPHPGRLKLTNDRDTSRSDSAFRHFRQELPLSTISLQHQIGQFAILRPRPKQGPRFFPSDDYTNILCICWRVIHISLPIRSLIMFKRPMTFCPPPHD